MTTKIQLYLNVMDPSLQTRKLNQSSGNIKRIISINVLAYTHTRILSWLTL